MTTGKSLLLIGLCCMLVMAIINATGRTRDQATPGAKVREEAAHMTINDFFKTWLIDKQADQAITFLHPKIFSDRL